MARRGRLRGSFQLGYGLPGQIPLRGEGCHPLRQSPHLRRRPRAAPLGLCGRTADAKALYIFPDLLHQFFYFFTYVSTKQHVKMLKGSDTPARRLPRQEDVIVHWLVSQMLIYCKKYVIIYILLKIKKISL